MNKTEADAAFAQAIARIKPQVGADGVGLRTVAAVAPGGEDGADLLFEKFELLRGLRTEGSGDGEEGGPTHGHYLNADRNGRARP